MFYCNYSLIRPESSLVKVYIFLKYIVFCSLTKSEFELIFIYKCIFFILFYSFLNECSQVTWEWNPFNNPCFITSLKSVLSGYWLAFINMEKVFFLLVYDIDLSITLLLSCLFVQRNPPLSPQYIISIERSVGLVKAERRRAAKLWNYCNFLLLHFLYIITSLPINIIPSILCVTLSSDSGNLSLYPLLFSSQSSRECFPL